LCKLNANNIFRRCVMEHVRPIILVEAHEGIDGGHYVGKDNAHEVLCTWLWWPTVHKDEKEYYQNFDVCQRGKAIQEG